MPSVVDFLWLLITYLAEMALAPSFVNRFSILKLHIRAKIHMHLFRVQNLQFTIDFMCNF